MLATVSSPVGTVPAVLNYTQPPSGCANITLSPFGALTLVPAANYFGNCSFTFTLLDEKNGTLNATVVAVIG